ncbi:hypothetical protein F5880DRAFT_1502674 [Lentinula raphanica]|nr:hypothetical protein F5880DRAFT_1502674 [Lentinula raphanica]
MLGSKRSSSNSSATIDLPIDQLARVRELLQDEEAIWNSPVIRLCLERPLRPHARSQIFNRATLFRGIWNFEKPLGFPDGSYIYTKMSNELRTDEVLQNVMARFNALPNRYATPDKISEEVSYSSSQTTMSSPQQTFLPSFNTTSSPSSSLVRMQPWVNSQIRGRGGHANNLIGISRSHDQLEYDDSMQHEWGFMNDSAMQSPLWMTRDSQPSAAYSSPTHHVSQRGLYSPQAYGLLNLFSSDFSPSLMLDSNQGDGHSVGQSIDDYTAVSRNVDQSMRRMELLMEELDVDEVLRQNRVSNLLAG